MVGKEFAPSDSPYAGRYVEYIEDTDYCNCGHMLTDHDEVCDDGGEVPKFRDACVECECKDFVFNPEHGAPDPDREYDDRAAEELQCEAD